MYKRKIIFLDSTKLLFIWIKITFFNRRISIILWSFQVEKDHSMIETRRLKNVVIIIQRKCKIIWFNLPFSMNVKTNVFKKFLKPSQHHFPKQHPMHEIFNHNKVKIDEFEINVLHPILCMKQRSLVKPTMMSQCF